MWLVGGRSGRWEWEVVVGFGWWCTEVLGSRCAWVEVCRVFESRDLRMVAAKNCLLLLSWLGARGKLESLGSWEALSRRSGGEWLVKKRWQDKPMDYGLVRGQDLGRLVKRWQDKPVNCGLVRAQGLWLSAVHLTTSPCLFYTQRSTRRWFRQHLQSFTHLSQPPIPNHTPVRDWTGTANLSPDFMLWYGSSSYLTFHHSHTFKSRHHIITNILTLRSITNHKRVKRGILSTFNSNDQANYLILVYGFYLLFLKFHKSNHLFRRETLRART